MEHDRGVIDLDELVAEGGIVFFGGAGVSTDSGIPDFRSAAGIYATAHGRLPPEYLLSHTCLVEEPELFFDFHRDKLIHPSAQPNSTHRALAHLEAEGLVDAVVTQNIDGLHQGAGSRVVHELHGSLHRNYCVACGAEYPVAFVLAATRVPRCACGGMIRPDVVLYEEALDPTVVDAATAAIASARTLIVGGTSLNVYPAAGLLRYYRGHQLVLINKSATAEDHRADMLLRAGLGDIFGRYARD